MNKLTQELNTIDEIDAELLEKIADMLGKPAGAINIRKTAAVLYAPAPSISRLIPAPMVMKALISVFSMVPEVKPVISRWL